MKQCWQFESEARPQFSEILTILESLKTLYSVSDFVLNQHQNNVHSQYQNTVSDSGNTCTTMLPTSQFGTFKSTATQGTLASFSTNIMDQQQQPSSLIIDGTNQHAYQLPQQNGRQQKQQLFMPTPSPSPPTSVATLTSSSCASSMLMPIVHNQNYISRSSNVLVEDFPTNNSNYHHHSRQSSRPTPICEGDLQLFSSNGSGDGTPLGLSMYNPNHHSLLVNENGERPIVDMSGYEIPIRNGRTLLRSSQI